MPPVNSIICNVYIQKLPIKKIPVGAHIIYTPIGWNMNSIKFIIFFLLGNTICLSQAFYGTTIIVQETQDILFIGADSRISFFEPNKPDVISTECKIQTIGDSLVFFATGTEAHDPLYDSRKIVDSCLRLNISPQVTINILSDSIRKTNHAFSIYYRGDSISFRSEFPDDFLFDFTIVKLHKRIFSYYYIRFYINMNNGKINIIADSTYAIHPKNGIIFGQSEFASKMPIRIKGAWEERIAYQIYRAIEFQCLHPNQFTGKPIRILIWNRNGKMKWYGDKQPCKASAK